MSSSENKNKVKVIAIMTAITTLQNVSISQVGPFFPLEATSKEVSQPMIGFIISLNPVCYVLASLFMGRKLQSFGRKSAMTVGLLLIVT